MRKFIIPALLTGTVVMMAVMNRTGAVLKTPATPMGIIDLEFAYDMPHADKVLAAWSAGNRVEAAIENTRLDFLFIFCYSLFLYVACKKVKEKFARSNWKYKAGKFMSSGALLAGVLDTGENLCMLQTLHGNGNSILALMTAICAGVKWLLAAMALLYIITALIVKRQVPK